MDTGTDVHLAALKEALLSLDATGAKGFEGLLAAVLSEICGQPFRLASSGSQRGRDGNSAFDKGATYFEAKLYRGKVESLAVAKKLLELDLDDEGQVDTWALCATSAISTQLEEQCRKSLAKNGIGCLILDWPDHAWPPLAVALALCPATTDVFISTHSTDKSKVAGLRAHLDAIAADNSFSAVAISIRSMLTEPTLGLGLAKAVNRDRLIGILSARQEARRAFGQPLAPLDPAGLQAVDRSDLEKKLSPAFVGAPEDQVFVILGEEGTGKSWLVASSWVRSNPSPLLVVFTAGELHTPMALHDLEGTIITKMASQAEGDTPAGRARWRRRFKSWRANPQPSNPRLVVFVDGLNQATDFEWPRWIDAAGKFLGRLGGHLIVTTTSRHFAQHLCNNVTASVHRIIVAEWTEEELRKILFANGISADGLSAEVTRFLRNPRILGIAVELLNARDIERFDELTVGRLLFEHIRRGARDGMVDVPAGEFASSLRDHADQIIARYSGQQRDDLKIFQVPLDGRLRAVSESRFFEDVPGEAQLYAIKEEGLPLALGLSLLSGLRKEVRNGRDPDARLSVILEPIMALGETADVVFSALEVACCGDQCPTSVTAALIRHLLTLQNLADERWHAFAGLVKAAPEAFLSAARHIALSEEHQPHARWLTAALLAARANPTIAAAIQQEVARWLGYYSLAPERRVISSRRHDAQAEIEAETAKRKAELDARIAGLSGHERAFVETRLARKDDGNLSGLQLLGLQLLSTTKLAGLADALVNCAFSNALNSGFDAPDKQFANLIRLNTVDWNEARDALMKSAAPLMTAETSSTGQWAFVEVLRATGHPDDAVRAADLVADLIKDRPSFSGWRRIEDYCATDPCDPGSSKPSNISDTAGKYAALDVSQLRIGMGHTIQDHLFDEARPGLARFEPDTAIDVTRKFARNAVGRDGLARRQAVLALVPHSALFTEEIVAGLLAIQADGSGAPGGNNKDQDSWITAQYALFAALPHKSGTEQLAIIAGLTGRSLLLRMVQRFKPADVASVEAQLERVVQDADAQARVMSFVHYSNSDLSVRARKLIGTLLGSADKLVRSLAMAVAARTRDRDLLTSVVASGWDAAKLDRKEHYFELWYGSAALIAAAEVGIADPSDVVGRIASGFYADALRLPKPADSLALSRIDAAFTKAVALDTISGIPLVEQPIPRTGFREPPLRSIVEEPQSSDIRDYFDRVNETREAFAARQKRAWDAVEQFAREVTRAEAGIILDDFSWAEFEAIVAAEPTLASGWLARLTELPEAQLRSMHYFALGLARASAKSNPTEAAALLRRLAKVKPFIRRVEGTARVPAEAVAAWANADLNEIRMLCFERLDRAADDAELAIEVHAAFASGRSRQIGEYIDLRFASGLPSGIARALMVAGFSDSNSPAFEVLQRFVNDRGFVGAACKAAWFAYERNVWARDWYERMRKAKSNEEFWCSSILLEKIVDGRYALWVRDATTAGSVFQQFFPTVEEGIQSRIKSWDSKRKNKLFGQDVPDAVFFGRI